MSADTTTDGQWFKSTRSAVNGCCVEVRRNGDGTVSVRDSKDPGPTLHFTGPQWAAFVAGAKDGEFD